MKATAALPIVDWFSPERDSGRIVVMPGRTFIALPRGQRTTFAFSLPRGKGDNPKFL